MTSTREITEAIGRRPVGKPFVANSFASRRRETTSDVLSTLACIEKQVSSADKRQRIYVRTFDPVSDGTEQCKGCLRLTPSASGCVLFERASAGDKPSVVYLE